MTIAEKEKEIRDTFDLFEDWMDKYAYLIELGKELPLIDIKYKTNQYLISGCQSRVWLYADLKDGKVVFSADSDAVITKGIISLLIKTLSGHTPDEILKADWNFLNEIGLREHLSPTRANGLTSMVRQIQLYAKAYQLKMNQ